MADDNALDMKNKFSKMRPLLDGLNRQSLDNFPPEQTFSIEMSVWFCNLASMVPSSIYTESRLNLGTRYGL